MEQRAYERFRLALPATVEVISSGGGRVFEARTRDISVKGVFLDTQEALPEGTTVRLDLIVENERIKKLTGAQGLIKVEGAVVRSTPGGIAIRFDGESKILGSRAPGRKFGDGLIALVSCSLAVVERVRSTLLE